MDNHWNLSFKLFVSVEQGRRAETRYAIQSPDVRGVRPACLCQKQKVFLAM
jgi:hypothetical protein